MTRDGFQDIYMKTSLHYVNIVDGMEVEVSNPKIEITISYNSESNNDKTPPKVSVASILCISQNNNEDRVPRKETTSQKEQTTKYILPRRRKVYKN
jgi:hypothetical protein